VNFNRRAPDWSSRPRNPAKSYRRTSPGPRAWDHLARAPCGGPWQRARRLCAQTDGAKPHRPPGGGKALRPVPACKCANPPQSNTTTKRRPTRRDEDGEHLPSTRQFHLFSKFRAASQAKRHVPCGVAGKLRRWRVLGRSRAARPLARSRALRTATLQKIDIAPGSIAGRECNVRGCRALYMLPENDADVAARPNPSSNHALWCSRATEKCMFGPAALCSSLPTSSWGRFWRCGAATEHSPR